MECDRLIADVMSCPGAADAVLAGIADVFENGKRVVFVKSVLGRHRSVVIAHMIADCCNLLEHGDNCERCVHAMVYSDVDIGSSNAMLNMFRDSIIEWIVNPDMETDGVLRKLFKTICVVQVLFKMMFRLYIIGE